jgi:transposase-like protein
MALNIPIPDEKRAAMAAALLSGSSVRAVAREFGVSPATASKIKNEVATGVFEPARTEKKEEAKAERREGIEVLIGNYLNQAFITLTAQAVEVAKPAYIERQNAESLAILHGVIADKTIRILEAAAAAQKIEPPKN